MRLRRYPSSPAAAGGGLTDAQLRAAPIEISGSGGGGLAIIGPPTGLAVIGPLTNAELRAAAVPVIDSAGLTDAQLRAAAVPVTDAAIGTVAPGGITGAYTALDRLTQATKRLDALIKLQATPPKPPVKPTYTLLHRG